MHHLPNGRFAVFGNVQHDEVFAGFDVVVKRFEFLVFGLDTDQPAFPRTKQGGQRNDGDIYERWHVRAERPKVDEQSHTGEPCDATHDRTDYPVTNQIQPFEVVAGMHLLFLQAVLVLGRDVQEKVLEADLMQILGNFTRAGERGGEIVNAFQGLSPQCHVRMPKPNNVTATTAKGSAGSQMGTLPRSNAGATATTTQAMATPIKIPAPRYGRVRPTRPDKNKPTSKPSSGNDIVMTHEL